MPAGRKPNGDEQRFREGVFHVPHESYREALGLPTADEPTRGLGLMIIRPIAGGVEIFTPAKLNLFLEVLGRRPDGYHEIKTVMVAVSLYDTLTLLDDPSGEIRLRCNDPNLPVNGENLVIQAADRLKAATGSGGGAQDRVDQGDPGPGWTGRRLERCRRDPGRPRSDLGPWSLPAAIGRPGDGGRQ